jgi:hypothetical protein
VVCVLAGLFLLGSIGAGVFGLYSWQRYREAQARAQAANNLKQISIATHQFEAEHAFPPEGWPDRGDEERFARGNFEPLLPWLEQPDLAERILILPGPEVQPSSASASAAMGSGASGVLTRRLPVFQVPPDVPPEGGRR